MSGDIRISNPGGTSLYEALSIKPQQVQKEEPQETPVQSQLNTTDKSNVKTQEKGKVAQNNVEFVDQKESEPKPIPLRVKDDGSLSPNEGNVGKFVVDEKGLPVLDKDGNFQLDEKNGKPVFLLANDKGEPLLDENNNIMLVESPKGEVPADNVDLTGPVKEKDPAPEVQQAQATEEKFFKAPLLDPETNKELLVKTDENGIPVVDDQGNFVPDPNGKPVYVKVDENNQPILKDGQLQFVGNNVQGDPNEEAKKATEKVTAALNSHSAKRYLTGFGYKSMAQWGTKVLSNTLIKGVSIGLPGGKAIGFGIKHAVAKAVGEELSKQVAKGVVKAGETTLIKASEKAVTSATGSVLKSLTTQKLIGQGIETLTMKEASKLAGGKLKAVIEGGKALKTDLAALKAVEKVAAEGAEAVAKSTAKSAAKSTAKKVATEATEAAVKGALKAETKAGVSTMLGVSGKVLTGAGEKALKTGVTEGIEQGVKAAVKRGGAEVAEKVVSKTSEKAITKAAQEAALKAATGKTAKVGTTVSKVGSVVGTAVGVGIVAWDAYDAYKKFKDPTVSTTSKALAGGTVVLSAASVALEKKYPALSWAATGLSIATSIGSDYYKDKK